MSKQAFASAIISKMKAAISADAHSFNEGTATAATAAIAQAITEYLIANTIVTVSYIGTIPGTPTMPDPLVIDTFKIVGVCAPPVVTQGSEFDDWVAQLEANIIAGFMLAPTGTAGLVFPMMPFQSKGMTIKRDVDLKPAHDPSDENPQQKLWEIICGDIMNWINTTALNPAILSDATHPPVGSFGKAKITMITLT